MLIRSFLMLASLAASFVLPMPHSFGDQIKLNVALSSPVMVIGDGDLGANVDGSKAAENHLRIALTGFDIPKSKERLPVNVAIVIDQSGSMGGAKIENARRAAIQAVDLLQDSDIVSIITYDDRAQVLVPATKASDRSMIREKIRQIQAQGSTALHAGVVQGAVELRKFLTNKQVNRMILLSDGQANIGPSSPAELGDLGKSLINEGISVTTLGLGSGYNEDLMTRLASASSGNHAFIENPEYLTTVFQNEFQDVQSVIAQQISVVADFAEGIRPVKVLGYPAEISGQKVIIKLGQLYAKQERYFVVECEIPLGEAERSRKVVDVSADYKNMITETNDHLTSSVEVRFTKSKEIASGAINKEVMSSCVLQIANEQNRLATELRDAGKISEAKALLKSNSEYLESNGKRLDNEALRRRGEDNLQQSSSVDSADWNISRKGMKALQYGDSNQQRYEAAPKK
ncbi:MAG: VWA domain-containing protein [Planctomycetota bacterium]|nr:VWA domain-containing protein [Planctomycetota bacterium]